MKLKVTSTEEDKPVKDGKPKKLKVKGGSNIKTQYSTYSGIINDKGESKDEPTEVEAVKNMAQYMKNNQSDQSSKSSNVYRPKFSHLGVLYNRLHKMQDA